MPYVTTCPNVHCGRPFQVNRFDDLPSLFATTYRFVCPHCGTGSKNETQSAFVTHALSSQDESALYRNR